TFLYQFRSVYHLSAFHVALTLFLKHIFGHLQPYSTIDTSALCSCSGTLYALGIIVHLGHFVSWKSRGFTSRMCEQCFLFRESKSEFFSQELPELSLDFFCF